MFRFVVCFLFDVFLLCFCFCVFRFFFVCVFVVCNVCFVCVCLCLLVLSVSLWVCLCCLLLLSVGVDLFVVSFLFWSGGVCFSFVCFPLLLCGCACLLLYVCVLLCVLLCSSVSFYVWVFLVFGDVCLCVLLCVWVFRCVRFLFLFVWFLVQVSTFLFSYSCGCLFVCCVCCVCSFCGCELCLKCFGRVFPLFGGRGGSLSCLLFVVCSCVRVVVCAFLLRFVVWVFPLCFCFSWLSPVYGCVCV